MSVSSYSERLLAMGLTEALVPNVVRAARFSEARIMTARLALQDIEQHPGVALIGLGSHGRYEASTLSDLDVAFLFDPTALPEEEARSLRRHMLSLLRREGFAVAEKTFDKPLDARTLLRNIGGRNETNEQLTYRAL